MFNYEQIYYMKVDLSIHAMDRLLSRTGLSLEDFKEIYNKEKILPIGKEKGSSRIHELLYCKFKNQCFISIRDEENFEVITILTNRLLTQRKNSEKSILPIKNFSNKNDALNFTDKLIK